MDVLFSLCGRESFCDVQRSPFQEGFARSAERSIFTMPLADLRAATGGSGTALPRYKSVDLATGRSPNEITHTPSSYTFG